MFRTLLSPSATSLIHPVPFAAASPPCRTSDLRTLSLLGDSSSIRWLLTLCPLDTFLVCSCVPGPSTDLPWWFPGSLPRLKSPAYCPVLVGEVCAPYLLMWLSVPVHFWSLNLPHCQPFLSILVDYLLNGQDLKWPFKSPDPPAFHSHSIKKSHDIFHFS